jgi:hypothetical protein
MLYPPLLLLPVTTGQESNDISPTGTLVFPHNKYLVLKMGNKEVLCEDVLESMVG